MIIKPLLTHLCHHFLICVICGTVVPASANNQYFPAVTKPAILVVDDDTAVLAAIERDLRKQYRSEYRVMKADSGADALDAAKELATRNTPVALFLVDQRMPGLSGTELLSEVMKSRRSEDQREGETGHSFGSRRATVKAHTLSSAATSVMIRNHGSVASVCRSVTIRNT